MAVDGTSGYCIFVGGSGGGIADNEEEFVEIIQNGLRLSRVGQVLVEKSIAGWKEIEYEVMRDGNGTCITVCNMENLDPVGNDENIGNPGVYRLFHDVLNSRLVHNGKHFLGHGFCGRQNAGA